MNEQRKPLVYRDLIDALVQVCKQGQGQIGPQRARAGVWNRNATQDSNPDQYKINCLLERMSPDDRVVLAGMLAHQVEVGVFESLKVLEEFQVDPFKEGYEGSPYEDFIGRLADWKWPET